MNSLVPAEADAGSECGESLEYRGGEAPQLLGVCRRSLPRFDFAISFAGYEGALRGLVHLVKYERLRPRANLLGARLADTIAGRKFDGDEPVCDRKVLIVDDVYITRTTLNECARALRAAGAKRVLVATVARVYRSVVEMVPGGRLQEENSAVLVGAVAG